MYLYHSTKPDWFDNGTKRLAFGLYLGANPERPYQDHAPLNAAMQASPGQNVYRVFFFEDEATAIERTFVTLAARNSVLLRIAADHVSLTSFLQAPDDRDIAFTAHMWYRANSTTPVRIGTDKFHPHWGVPFADIDILDREGGNWMALTDWLAQKKAREQPPQTMQVHFEDDPNPTMNVVSRNALDPVPDSAAPPKRYQVFTAMDASTPAFSTHWRWIARWHARRIAKRGGYCRIEVAGENRS